MALPWIEELFLPVEQPRGLVAACWAGEAGVLERYALHAAEQGAGSTGQAMMPVGPVEA